MEIIVGDSVINGGGARNHDLLAAFMTIFITRRVVKLTLPACFRTNEQIRLHALSTVLKNLGNADHSNKSNNLQQIVFKCYDGGKLFYISDDEKKLVSKIMGTCLAQNSIDCFRVWSFMVGEKSLVTVYCSHSNSSLV